MKTLVAVCLLVVIVMLGACSAEGGDNVKVLKETLGVLNDEGVIYSGTVEGPLQAGFEMYTGGRVTSGGWVSLRVQSPVQNPMGRNEATPADEPIDAPIETPAEAPAETPAEAPVESPAAVEPEAAPVE